MIKFEVSYSAAVLADEIVFWSNASEIENLILQLDSTVADTQFTKDLIKKLQATLEDPE